MKYVAPLNGDLANPNRPYTDGVPGISDGSIPSAEFFNELLAELVNVLTQAGLTPSSADLTQLWQAIQLAVAAGLSGRVANMFQPGPTSPASMKVHLAAGHIFTDGSLTEVSAQDTVTLAAPVAPNSRIDRIVIDRATGAVSVIAGTPGVAPVAPAIPSGKQPVARVLLTPTTVTITAANITDERDLFALGLGLAAFAGLGADIGRDASGNLTRSLIAVGHIVDFAFAATDRGKRHYFYAAGKTGTLLAAATAGAGWTIEIVDFAGGAVIASPETNIYVNGDNAAVASYTFVDGEWGELLSDSFSYFLITNQQPSQLRKGYYGPAVDYGTITGGTVTPTYVGGNYGIGVANGAFNLAAPTAAGNFTLILELTNGASAGAVTATGYTTADLSALTTTAGDKFIYYIIKINGYTTVRAEALQ